MHWHRSLDEVPDDLPTVYIAHEFLDALPVHQFQKTERGWCERLIDIASDDSPLHFRLVLSPRPTPASKLLVDRRLGALPFDQSRPATGSLLAVGGQAVPASGEGLPSIPEQSAPPASCAVDNHFIHHSLLTHSLIQALDQSVN